MRASVRLGKNPTTGKTYPPLEDSTIDSREYLEDYNQTGDFYKSEKSNNHFSGQLDKSLDYEVKANSVEVGIQDDGRTPYKGKNGRYKNGIGNEDLAEALADQGRPVIGASDKTKKIVKNKVISEINRQFRKN